MCSPNWFGRFHHKVNDVAKIWKIENSHQISIFHSVDCFVNELRKIEYNHQISIFHSVDCFVNELQKIENNHQISIFHSVDCFVIEVWKVNNTTLETGWLQEATFNSYIGNWILNFQAGFLQEHVSIYVTQ